VVMVAAMMTAIAVIIITVAIITMTAVVIIVLKTAVTQEIVDNGRPSSRVDVLSQKMIHLGPVEIIRRHELPL
jgi:hypothetical protein